MSWQDTRAKGGKTGLGTDSGGSLSTDCSSSSTMAKVPKQYSVSLKLQVAQFAIANSNAEAERKFGINESCIRRWRKEITNLKMLNKASATSAKQQQTLAKKSTGGSEGSKLSTEKKTTKVVTLPAKTWQRGRKSKVSKLAGRGRGRGKPVESIVVESSNRGRGRALVGTGRSRGFGGIRGRPGLSGR
ncbi:unnamed protein product [Meganyctiphanes norvegica]|uniref:Brinker DNA-binding domain-containing protein n=1 Tax=Meganyctiphanes norvegica TaxID=48144 RepID=A0AAV2RY32_MEGNR